MNNRFWFLAPLVCGLSLTGAPQVSGQPHVNKPAAARSSKARQVPPSSAASMLEIGPAEVDAERVNLRARADVDSEPVGRLNRGDVVQVLEQVVISKPGPGEPARWAKIAWPSDAPVWVYGGFLDASASTVKVAKLNVRSGPGENHSVVGDIERGVAVKKISASGDWWKVEAPAGCVAFVASSLLKSKPAGAIAVIQEKGSVPAPAAPPIRPVAGPFSSLPNVPPSNPVRIIPPAQPKVAAPLVPPPPAPVPAAPSLNVATAPRVTPPPASTPPPLLTRAPGEIDLRPIREDAFVKRTVSREGRVRRSYNLQAPTDMFLENLYNGRIMNYLYSTSTNLNFDAYRGRVVRVIGEEALDERWPNIPVIRVETLHTDP